MPIPTELFATITGRLAPGGPPDMARDPIAVWRALFEKFAPLIGTLGTELLFARSLAVHTSAYPWLPQAAPGTPRRVLDAFERSLDNRSPDEIAAANHALLATFTANLCELIGAGLVIHFLLAALPHDRSSKNS